MYLWGIEDELVSSIEYVVYSKEREKERTVENS